MPAYAVARLRPLWLCALPASACTAFSLTRPPAKESAAMTLYPHESAKPWDAAPRSLLVATKPAP